MSPPATDPPKQAPKRSRLFIATLIFVGINVAILLAVLQEKRAAPLTPSVTGRVRLIGKPPPEKPLPLDSACAKLWAGNKPTTRFYVVGEDGGLGDVFVYLKSGLTNHSFQTPTNPVVMRQRGCLYLDYVVGAQTGQLIVVRNTDPILHNVHVTPRAPGNKQMNMAQLPGARATATSRPSRLRQFWDSLAARQRGLLGMAPPAPPMVSEVTFQLARPDMEVRLKCDVHPWEFGYVYCVDHPFFAVTDSNGQFRFPQPPPAGNYVIEAYHRKAGTQTREIEVKLGEPLKVDFELTVPK